MSAERIVRARTLSSDTRFIVRSNFAVFLIQVAAVSVYRIGALISGSRTQTRVHDEAALRLPQEGGE